MAERVRITRPGGRRLDVELSGPPDGRAVLCHHGTPDAGGIFVRSSRPAPRAGCGTWPTRGRDTESRTVIRAARSGTAPPMSRRSSTIWASGDASRLARPAADRTYWRARRCFPSERSRPLRSPGSHRGPRTVSIGSRGWAGEPRGVRGCARRCGAATGNFSTSRQRSSPAPALTSSISRSETCSQTLTGLS